MKLVEIGGSIYGAVNRQWYQAAVKRFGQKVADEMHHEVWFAEGGAAITRTSRSRSSWASRR
jgi:hypothetical protein